VTFRRARFNPRSRPGAEGRLTAEIYRTAIQSVYPSMLKTRSPMKKGNLNAAECCLADTNTGKSDVIHIHELPPIGLRAQLGEGSIIEQVSDGVACLDHDQTNRAGALVAAIGARPERGD
jgi:hypothetical protein